MTVSTTMKRVLVALAILVLVVAVGFGLVGWAMEGTAGAVSGVIGAALALLYSGMTVASVAIASRYQGPTFLGIVLAVWAAKFLLFVLVLILLRGQPFIVPVILVSSLIVSAIGSLVIDVMVVLNARIGLDVPAAERPDAAEDGAEAATDAVEQSAGEVLETGNPAVQTPDAAPDRRPDPAE